MTPHATISYNGPLGFVAKRLYDMDKLNASERDLLASGFVPASQSDLIHAEVEQ